VLQQGLCKMSDTVAIIVVYKYMKSPKFILSAIDNNT